MFLQELSPIFEELIHKPVAFMGGFASGLFRLDLSEDPVRLVLLQFGLKRPTRTVAAHNLSISTNLYFLHYYFCLKCPGPLALLFESVKAGALSYYGLSEA
jgi:hypothetical protein